MLYQQGCQSIAAGCGSVDVRIQTAVKLLRIGSHVADISCAVRVASIGYNTGDDAAFAILAIDIDLRSRAVATDLDGVTLVVRVDEVTRRLEARIQSRQVLADGLAALDVRAIFVDMDFLVERVTRNQARIAGIDLALAFDIDGVLRRRRIRAFFNLHSFRIYAVDNFDCILGDIMDSRLAGIREVTILNLSDFIGIVRHFFIDFV